MMNLPQASTFGDRHDADCGCPAAECVVSDESTSWGSVCRETVGLCEAKASFFTLPESFYEKLATQWAVLCGRACIEVLTVAVKTAVVHVQCTTTSVVLSAVLILSFTLHWACLRNVGNPVH